MINNMKENRSKLSFHRHAMEKKSSYRYIGISLSERKMKKISLEYKLFKAFLQHPEYGPKEMAAYLNANYGSVTVIYARLCKDGLLKRDKRGQYSPQVPHILFDLYFRIEKLEKG